MIYLVAILISVIAILTYYLYTSKKQNLTLKADPNLKYSQTDLNQEIKKALDRASKEQNPLTEEEKSKLREEFAEKNELIIGNLKLKLKEEIEKEEKEMRKRLLELQENIDKKETLLNQKLDKVSAEKDKIEQVKDELREIKTNLLVKRDQIAKEKEEAEQQIEEKLEEVSKIKFEDAKKKVLEQAEEKMGQELIEYQNKIVTNAEEEANLKAREIVAQAIQRCSSEVTNELTITSIKLNSEDEKGKIIGKSGRNIQWLEKTLGVELIVDETPEVVTLSGFSSVRRNIAKRTLEMLIKDGRIHPSSIEETHQKAKAEIAGQIAQAGEDAVNELGIYDFPAKLIRLIGRLKFRTSYGQNMLKHSLEMAKLAGLLADELNSAFPNSLNPIDKMVCIKGALLHDIGKAVDEEMNPKGNHVELGEKICDMFNLDWRIKMCISSHHNENYKHPENGFCVEAVVVDACDNISGSRPGARKETAEAYFQRIEALERVAKSVKGVKESWVMRGSKEMWVFFDTDKISPSKMNQATRQIARDISISVKSPVKIKVIGFYDKRIVEFAG